MSSAGNWTYIYPVTIWPVTIDEFSQPVFGTPYAIKADWMQGGEAQASSNGEQFIPSCTFYFEAADGSELIPKPHDYILRGDQTAISDPTTINAERIKKVGGWPAEAFGAGELPDWVIYT